MTTTAAAKTSAAKTPAKPRARKATPPKEEEGEKKQPAQRISIVRVYGYHPPDEVTPDLWLPTEVAAHYHVANMDHRRPIDPPLEADIREKGILFPLTIYTNGQHALIGDGNHRVRIAIKLGLEKVPVQVLPDNLRRKASRCGHPVLEPVLNAWVQEHLWPHHDHEVFRRVIGGKAAGGIEPNRFANCRCSCNARWREYL
jgi:ParB-like nuclease domain